MKFNKDASILPLCKQRLGELPGEYVSVLYCDAIGEDTLPEFISLVQKTDTRGVISEERVRYVQEVMPWRPLELLYEVTALKDKPIEISKEEFQVVMVTVIKLKLVNIDLYTFHGKYFVCCSGSKE